MPKFAFFKFLISCFDDLPFKIKTTNMACCVLKPILVIISLRNFFYYLEACNIAWSLHATFAESNRL